MSEALHPISTRRLWGLPAPSLRDAGALPAMPNYSMQIGWQALLAQSPHREHVAATRGRADLLNRMAGSVESAAMKKAQATGNADELREQLGLAAFQPGRLASPTGSRPRCSTSRRASATSRAGDGADDERASLLGEVREREC